MRAGFFNCSLQRQGDPKEAAMGLISTRRNAPAAAAFGVLLLLAAPASAQPGATAPAPTTPNANDPDRNSPAHNLSLDIHMVVRPDLAVTVNSTSRFKILRESAIRALGQQSVPYVESLNPLEVVEIGRASCRERRKC